MSDTEVRLVGEGGVEWTFTLPLAETYADQVAKGQLRPADDESAAALAQDGGQPTTTDDGDVSVDAMSGKQLDEFAAKLEVPDWKSNAKVPAKKEALKSFIAAKTAADA